MTTLPPFERHAPRDFAAASELLATHGEDAVVYAGGTELFLLFKLGFAEYPHVIDIKGLPELRGIELANGALRIGAGETHRTIERDALVRERWPDLAAMERGVGNLRVRTMGTIGGNLCFADPHSDPMTFLLAANATLEALGGSGERRTIPLAEFNTGPFENALRPGELLAAVEVPTLAPGAAVIHQKFVLHERPAITVAAHLRLQGERVTDVRLAVGSAGTRASRAAGAERLLEGIAVSELEGALGEVGEHAADAAAPVEDSNGSVDYKRHMVEVIVGRVLREAVARPRSA
jgi:carbon-monoxide dehydrogenase medium subunit